MHTSTLALITLVTALRISHQQNNHNGTVDEVDNDDHEVNPYPVLPYNHCQSLPEFFSEKALHGLGTRFGCFVEFIHAESFLKDVSRLRFYEFFRNQSQLLVSGTCPSCLIEVTSLKENIRYGNIFLMRQHWTLEYSAYFFFCDYNCPLFMARKIPGVDFPSFGNYDKGTLPNIVLCESYFTVTSMKIKQEEKQEDAVKSFIHLMMSGYDLLKTWNDTDYILGSASHYGCAIIIKDNVTGNSGLGDTLKNDRTAYLACVFLAYGSLVSYRGVMNDSSCDNNFGFVQYFSSIETSLCMSLNFHLTNIVKTSDIACEEEYKLPNKNSTDKERVHDDFLSGLQFFMFVAPVAFSLLGLIALIHSCALDWNK